MILFCDIKKNKTAKQDIVQLFILYISADLRNGNHGGRMTITGHPMISQHSEIANVTQNELNFFIFDL
jgi:hypothetical protein